MKVRLEVEGKEIFTFDIPPEYFIDFLYTIPYFFIQLENEDPLWVTERVGVIQKRIDKVIYTYVIAKNGEENENRSSDTNQTDEH